MLLLFVFIASNAWAVLTKNDGDIVERKVYTFPDYGQAKTGKIALQDHGNKAYYKNIKIRPL